MIHSMKEENKEKYGRQLQDLRRMNTSSIFCLLSLIFNLLTLWMMDDSFFLSLDGKCLKMSIRKVNGCKVLWSVLSVFRSPAHLYQR